MGLPPDTSDEEKLEQALRYQHDVGFDEGYDCGFEDGYDTGYSSGWEDGQLQLKKDLDGAVSGNRSESS